MVNGMSDLIRAHLRHMEAAGLARNTIDDRGELLHRLNGLLPMGLDESTTEELEDYLATPGFKSQTRATYYTHIVGYFRWATDPSRVHLDYDPSACLVRPRVAKGVPKPVTDEQLQLALGRLEEPWRTYVLLAAYQGARCCEIASITKEDINERRTRLTGKGGKTRVLKTHGVVWAAVQHFPAGRIARLLTSDRPPRPTYISAETSKRLTRIGLDATTLHAFRHWFATTMLRPREFGGGGASLRCVQENMGHASPAVTAVYTQVADEERDAGIDALPTFHTSTPS
jgi:integrase